MSDYDPCRFDKHDKDPDLLEARRKRTRYFHYVQEDGTVVSIPYIVKDEPGDEKP